MKILVDADACPAKEILLSCAKKHQLPVVMVSDVTHLLFSDDPLVTVVTVDQGADSADLAIANRAAAGDLCITQDYGLAALLLAKNAVVLHPNGFFYTAETIDQMLFERHLSGELRRRKQRKGGKHCKRTKAADEKFRAALEKALEGK